jgi:hypothetical protein
MELQIANDPQNMVIVAQKNQRDLEKFVETWSGCAVKKSDQVLPLGSVNTVFVSTSV